MSNQPLQDSINVPAKSTVRKRLSSFTKGDEHAPNKRTKSVHHKSHSESESDFEDETGDAYDSSPPIRRVIHDDPFRLHLWNACPRISLSWLQGFVSSKITDVHRCHHRPSGSSLVPPYSCAYNHAGKSTTGTSLLATGMEDGSLLLFDTRPSSSEFHPPPNQYLMYRSSIFSLAWHSSDTYIAMGRGDQTVNTVNVETSNIDFQSSVAHQGTVRCITWDPESPHILSSGSRDGNILRWDVRMGAQSGSQPIQRITSAHAPEKRDNKSTPTSITNILHTEAMPHCLVSSGSADGVLKCWDLRNLSDKGASLAAFTSNVDPTTTGPSLRPRGIISICEGSGPSSGVLFAFARNGKVYTYTGSCLSPLDKVYTHPRLFSESWYTSASASPCGRWLACGGTGKQGNAFIFDIRTASHSFSPKPAGVQLENQFGQIGMLDWDREGLAVTSDTGMVRIWRHDQGVRSECTQDPEAMTWKYSWAS